MADQSRAITVVEGAGAATLYGTEDPQTILDKATAKATVLAKVVKDKHLYVTIGEKDHVQVEGWTFLGSMCGVFPVTVWTRATANGWEARVEARTLNGETVGGAEASCNRDEVKWADKPDYALRSMAQTRATSKAMRLPLGYIMTLAGYATTPAEEMEGIKPEPDKASKYYCAKHGVEWFKRGKMQHYAHPIEGTREWCNMPKEGEVMPTREAAPGEPIEATARDVTETRLKAITATEFYGNPKVKRYTIPAGIYQALGVANAKELERLGWEVALERLPETPPEGCGK